MDLAKAIQYGWPNATEYSMGDTYDTLVWNDPIIAKPTLEEVGVAWQAYVANRESTAYQRLREKEYPTLDELNVAMWEKLIEGRSDAADELQILRLAIKDKYPKPEQI